MRILDLFCGAGGAAVGYARAGFEVLGVDHIDQPRFPYAFYQADALDVLADVGVVRALFDAVHASPPCQAYAPSRTIRGRQHPDLIAATRAGLEATGLPWVIENVPGAPLRHPVLLEGQMFDGLRTRRPRYFETNWPLEVPFLRSPPPASHTKMGRPARPHEWVHVVGHAPDVAASRAAMGIDWMTRDELSQAVPPAYTELIGTRLAAWVAAG